MTILRERQTWVRQRTPKRADKLALTEDEQDFALTVLRLVCRVHRGMARAATYLGTSRTVVKYVLSRKRPVSSKLAVRLAKIAIPAMADMVAGRWPAPGACPYCGQRAPARVPSLFDRIKQTGQSVKPRSGQRRGCGRR